MRLRIPDGFQIPPHYHSGLEHVTVIAGTFNVGVGGTFDRTATKPMPAGTFGYWSPPMRNSRGHREKPSCSFTGGV